MKAGSNDILLRRLKDDTRGTSLVEFAVIIPLLMIVVLGVIEVSFALLDQHIVTKLTREGSNLISRETSLADAATVMKSLSARPVDFTNNSRLIFSVIRRGATSGTSNYDKDILYQRYEVGGIAATSALTMRGGGTFGSAPDFQATASDSNTGLQLNNVPAGLLSTPGDMVYVTEIFTKQNGGKARVEPEEFHARVLRHEHEREDDANPEVREEEKEDRRKGH
jgi:Flp pilus assembly pilin Flp